MTNKEYNFNYNELNLDMKGMQSVLGYPGSPLPAPFDTYLEEAMDFASQLTEIRAAFRIVDPVRLDHSKGSMMADGKSFLVGKTVCKELRKAERLLFFVCTAGKQISEKSAILLKGEDPAKGYIYDLVGTYLTEAAGDRMQQLVREELPDGDRITNRYSPGYCHWDVADQHQLFSLFPPAPCGVTLTQSALMHPVKSISGVIGIGKEVIYRDYPCALCQSLNCIYRRTHS